MEMLVHGGYKGVQFRSWTPSRKKLNKLRLSHPFEFIRYQYKF